MKKSTKRSKRRVKTRKKQNVKRAKPHMANDGYSDGSVRLAELFRSRDPHDICVALNVSDLWLPNVASQIRHTFAFCVLASIKPAEFTSEKGLDSYDDFRDFIREVQKLAPTFPMLEDYVPETDWGEVKTLSGDKFLRLFYGCSIERMSDFVEAFKVKYDGMDLPLADLHIALSIQNAIISQIDRDIVGNPTNCAPGHMELPSETFWKQCSSAIKSIAAPSAARGKISDDMVIALGTLTLPADASAFSNALMNGKLLQAVLLTIDSDRYPISIRNSLGAVIDYWSASEVTQKHITITSSVANFLSKRFPQEGVLTGPLSIVTPTSKLPYRFAALANLGHRCELIVVLGEKELPLLPQIEEDVRRLLSSGQQWGIKQDGLSRVAQIGDKDHNLIGADNVSLIAVTTDISTAARVMHLPETSAHVLWLPDFLTIFDSLKGVDELTRFWSYLEEVHPQISFGLTSIVDMFATFRDTHGVLIEGALNPTSIFLDPHWGSSWRYRELKEFWENAPAMFPGDSHAGWTTSPPSGGIGQLIARASHSMSWYTTIGRCVLHFVMQLDTQELDSLNGRLLELLVQCLADSLFERRAIVEHLEEFKYQRIVTILEANEALLAANAHTEESVLRPLFSNWQIDPISDNTVSLAVAVNLTRVQTELTNPKASQFEVECASEWIAGIERLMGTAGLANCVPQLVATGSRTPRFSISVTRRTIDAPDHAQARLPEPTQYKAARRDLAVTFRALGVSPGRYELAAGKAAMDPARDQFRADIRARVAKLDRIALLTFCIEQHDALTVDYVRTTSRIRHSLTHQVSFDRPAELAKAYDHFSRNARNYRYLIELCLSEQSDGSEHPTRELIVELIAKIDWLFVLYDASDVLHNDIEVAGIEISDSFVPKVFYSYASGEGHGADGLRRA